VNILELLVLVHDLHPMLIRRWVVVVAERGEVTVGRHHPRCSSRASPIPELTQNGSEARSVECKRRCGVVV
jgi:hypothetical protein